MSKLTHKCPNCGATMPVDVKYCRKCHAKMDSGRVEVLSTPAKEQHPQKQSKKKDALRNLPKPVRPVEDEATAETAPAPEEQAPVREEGGYFSPDAREQTDAASGRDGTAVRRERRAPYGSDVPRPVSTARGAGAQAAPDRNRDRNLWQIITVLAIILVIIVVAILLVIRLNQPANGASDPYEGSNSAAVGTAEPSATPGTPGEDAEHAPEGLIVPTATPAATPTPTPVPTPTATPIPAATATPMPSPTAATNGNYSVTPTNDTVYINGNGVNVRSGPGTNYQAIGSENTGKQLQRTGRTSNGWSQVAYNGQTAYVIDSLLTTTQPSSGTGTGTSTGATSGVTAASGTVKVTEPLGANLRSGPGTNYSIVATVAVNTELTRTGTSGGWTVVSYNGQNVYISSNLVTDSASGTSTGTSTGTNTGTTTGVTAASGTLTVTGNSVNIRSGPGTNYSRIGSVNSGNTLTITGTSGNWYQVSYNGQTGYIISDYVTKN